MAMILHPGTKTLIRSTDEDFTGKKSARLISHLKRCARCRKKQELLSSLERVSKPKKSLSPNFRQRLIENLKEVKRSPQPIVAEIRKIAGAMTIFRHGEEHGVEGFPGMGLQKGYTIRLIGNSRALIELNDGSHIYLNQDTEIAFPLTVFNLAMSSGEIFAMMKPQRERLEIQTPSAVLGIIGTDFDAQVTEKKNTILRVLKGKVSFKNESGSVIVKSKHEVAASQYTKPEPTKIKNTKTISTWTTPIKLEKRGSVAKCMKSCDE
jgi:ferric-dicitrate binding protein FerR (iron transport regulator)